MAEDGLPQTGHFDYSVIRYVVYQYGDRKTFEMIQRDLGDLYGLEVSSQIVEKIFERGVQMLKPTRDEIKKEKVHPPPVRRE